MKVFVPQELLERAKEIDADYAFSSDGCSGMMSWAWRCITGDGPLWEGCCVYHDFEYWKGGSREDRRKADKQLRQCVIMRAHEYALVGLCCVWCIAWAMWTAVRLFGGPRLPWHFRWAYGYHYPKGYTK